MHSPLPSEAEAFRWVVIIGSGAGAVIAATLIFSATVGVIVMALLLSTAALLIGRHSRGSEPTPAEIARRDDEIWRILVVANQTVGGKALLEEISNRSRGRKAEIRVVTPALTTSKLDHWASATDEAAEDARKRLEDSLGTLAGNGIQATGTIGDSDPNVAIRDALLAFGADEIVISTHPPGRSRWIEHGVVERAREEIDLPISHVVVDLEAERAAA